MATTSLSDDRARTDVRSASFSGGSRPPAAGGFGLEQRLACYLRHASAPGRSQGALEYAQQPPFSRSAPSLERVRLSPLGRKLAHWYQGVQEMRDRADRDAALDGIAYLKDRLVAARDDRPLSRYLLEVVSDCSARSDAFQHQTFAVIGRLVRLGLPLEDWGRLYCLIRTTERLATMVEESLDLLHEEQASEALTATFQIFLNLWAVRGHCGTIPEAAEKRRYTRKKIRIPGHFEPMHSLARSAILIEDICPGGIGFQSIGRKHPRADDLIRVFFLLDGYLDRCIDKMAVVRRFDGRYAGAEFV